MFDPPQDFGLGCLVPLNNTDFPQGYPDAMYLAWFTRQLRRGNIPLMTAGWDSPENEWVGRCIKSAGR
jgi:hypothetical protein